MTDHLTPSDRIDAAYATAAETLDDPSALRRRAALLDAVAGEQSIAPKTAANATSRTSPVRRSPRRWWGAMAAAAVVGLSSLLVLKMEGERGPQPASTEIRADLPTEQREQFIAADKPIARPPVDAAKSAERRTPAERRSTAQQTEAAPPSAVRESLSISSADRAEPQPSAAAGGLPVAPPLMAKASPSVGLIAAVDAGDIDAVKRRLALTSADAEKDAKGRTALAHAVLASKPELVRLLLQAGADRLARDHAGQTPLDLAAAIGDAKVLEALRQR